MATTHQHVLFFTNKGRAFRLRAYEIPDSTRQARGTALVNLLTLPPGENVSAVFPVRNFDTDEYLVMVTRKGVIKKTRLDEFSNVRRNGLIAIGLDDDDELLGVDLSDGTRDIILATHDGMAVHFNEKDVRPMGRPARGVRAMSLAPGDSVVAMDIVGDERREVLIVTSQAFGNAPTSSSTGTPRAAAKASRRSPKKEEIGYVVDQILVDAGRRAADDHLGQPGHPYPGQPDPSRRAIDQGRTPPAACRGRRGHRDREFGPTVEARQRHHRRDRRTGLTSRGREGIMFTPRTFSIGDRVKINRDLSNREGMFGAGHEFEIVDLYARDGIAMYDLRDHESHMLIEVPFSDLESE